MAELNGKRIAFLVDNYFEQVEYTGPRDALEESGAATELLATEEGEVQGLNHVEMGDKFAVDSTIKAADPADYDAMVVPGGVVNADHLRMSEEARNFLRKFVASGKPVAIICHGPWLLVSAGLARGKKLTSYFTLQDDITNAGGEWVDEEVVVDGNLITSRKPDDIPAFSKALIDKL